MKTNVIYSSVITDDSSVLTESVFTDIAISYLKSEDVTKEYGVWGNALAPTGMLYSITDTSPASSTLSAASSNFGSLSFTTTKLLLQSNTSIGIDLGSSKTVDYLKLVCFGPAGYITKTMSGAGNFVVYYSNNNTSWTSLSTVGVGQTLNQGELLFSITPTSARYFKINCTGTPTINGTYSVYASKLYAINTSLGSQFKMKIDLGNSFSSSSLFIQTGLRRDSTYLAVSSSTDDSSYTTNTISFGGSWSTLTSSPVFGKIMYYQKHGAIYLCSSSGIYKYNFVSNSWSTVNTNSVFSTHASHLADIDNSNGRIYSVSGTKGLIYDIERDSILELPNLPIGVDNYSAACFSNGSFYVTTTSSGTDSYIRYGSSMLKISYKEDRWVVLDLFASNMNLINKYKNSIGGLFFSKPSLLFSSLVAVNSAPIYYYDTTTSVGAVTTIPNMSNNSYNDIDYGIGTLGGDNTDSVARPLVTYDSDRNILYFINQGNGYNFATRYFDFFIDLNLSELFSFTTGVMTGTTNIFDFKGPAVGGSCYMVYVPETKKIYHIGGFDSSGSGTDFVSYDTNNFISIHAPLVSNARYVKIQNTTSSTHWPLLFRSLSIIEDDSNIKFGSSKTDIIKQNTFSVGSAGEPSQIDVFNNNATTTSGSIYIEPTGAEGSRYYQISVSSGSGYIGHCLYNDLENFVCTASNTNYDTTSCGVLCTADTGTHGYSKDSLPISSLVSSGTTSFYCRSRIPIGKAVKDRNLDCIVELN